jgi:ribosomal protein S18 acetylase RimI-like enzyme
MADKGIDFEIRAVTRAEAFAWRALRLEMLCNEPLAFSSSYEDQVGLDLAFFAGRIPEDGVDVLFGVYVDGELSGSAGFSREAGLKVSHKGLMWSVYLRPHLRGRGIGEALAGRLIDHARQHVSVLQCSVTSDNLAARALYRRMGFVEYGVEARALRYEGKDYAEVLLAISFD